MVTGVRLELTLGQVLDLMPLLWATQHYWRCWKDLNLHPERPDPLRGRVYQFHHNIIISYLYLVVPVRFELTLSRF